jgi:SAM-dependent methyltransferase
MHGNVALFVALSLDREAVRGKSVLEVGSLDHNGSVRPLLQSYGPARYIGADIIPGKGVDVVCDASALAARFGPESFDIVVCTEMLEHARDWRAAVNNIKSVCRAGGRIVITTRSFGFKYHAYPGDFWRYEVEDMKRIFADMEILTLEEDPVPGVFLLCRKPEGGAAAELEDVELFSMALCRRVKDISDRDLRWLYFRPWVVKEKLKDFVSGWMERLL